MHVRSASTFSATASDPTTSRKMAASISAPVQPRSASLASSRGSAPSSTGATKPRGKRCALSSTACWSAGRTTSAMAPARQRTARSTITSPRAYGVSWSIVTGSLRKGPDGSQTRSSSASLAWFGYASSLGNDRRGSWMKLVGEPDAGNPHVRFDERGGETGRWPHGPKSPRLSSTLPHQLIDDGVDMPIRQINGARQNRREALPDEEPQVGAQQRGQNRNVS